MHSHMGKGRGTGVDAHRLTPQNLVPLPDAKIGPAGGAVGGCSWACVALAHLGVRRAIFPAAPWY